MKNKTGTRYAELFENTVIIAIGSFSSKVLVFFLVPLYTSVLSSSEYGFYDLIYTSLQLAVPILSLNVSESVFRFTVSAKSEIKKIVSFTTKCCVYSILPAFMVLSAFAALGISDWIREYYVYILIFYISYMFNQYMIQLAKGIDKIKKMTISGVIGTVFMVGGNVIFLLVIKNGLRGFFVANILGQLIPAVYLFFSMHFWKMFSLTGNVDKDLKKMILKYSAPLILTNIGWWINNASDRYIITWGIGIDAAGILSVAYKIPSIIAVVYGLFIQAWQISATKEYEKSNSGSFYNKIFISLNIFLYYMISLFLLFTKPIASIMFAEDFYSAWIFVPFLLLSSYFSASAGFIAPILTARYDTKTVAYSTITGGVVNILLNIILMFWIGTMGVTIATAFSSFIIFAVRYYSARDVISGVNLRRVLALWLAILIQVVLEINSVYFFQFVPVVVVSVLFRKTLIEYIRVLKLTINKRLKMN